MEGAPGREVLFLFLSLKKTSLRAPHCWGRWQKPHASGSQAGVTAGEECKVHDGSGVDSGNVPGPLAPYLAYNCRVSQRTWFIFSETCRYLMHFITGPSKSTRARLPKLRSLLSNFQLYPLEQVSQHPWLGCLCRKWERCYSLWHNWMRWYTHLSQVGVSWLLLLLTCWEYKWQEITLCLPGTGIA